MNRLKDVAGAPFAAGAVEVDGPPTAHADAITTAKTQMTRFTSQWQSKKSAKRGDSGFGSARRRSARFADLGKHEGRSGTIVATEGMGDPDVAMEIRGRFRAIRARRLEGR